MSCFSFTLGLPATNTGSSPASHLQLLPLQHPSTARGAFSLPLSLSQVSVLALAPTNVYGGMGSYPSHAPSFGLSVDMSSGPSFDSCAHSSSSWPNANSWGLPSPSVPAPATIPGTNCPIILGFP